jgi:hypothetical protein
VWFAAEPITNISATALHGTGPDMQTNLNSSQGPAIAQEDMAEQRPASTTGGDAVTTVTDPCERPHRQCFMSAPIHTHTHAHTQTLHAVCTYSTQQCTYAAVRHTAASIQIAHHAFLYQNTCDALTHTLTYPHLHLHSPSFTHITTLADTNAISLANQQQEQSHSHPLL